MDQSKEGPVKKIKFRLINRTDISTWSVDKVISDYIPPTWEKIFEKTTEERKVIAELVRTKVLPFYGEVYPLPEHIYRTFDLCPLDKVRVVIVGQDPYPQKERGKPKAVGMSFSIAPDDPSIPGSLKNIYKELGSEYPEFKIPHHGDLRHWVRQGVLLLNVALEFAPGENQGKNIARWKPFFIKTIKALVEYRGADNLIFVLWGDKAQKATLPHIGNAKSLISGHPSPQAVNFGGNFPGNGHFKKINEILEERGQQPIHWQV